MSSKKNSTNNKNEGRLKDMNETKNIIMNLPQVKRVLKHRIKTEENMFVQDRLENGYLKIYKLNTDSPTCVQYQSINDYIHNATLIGMINITIHLKDKLVLIHNIYCKDGYEKLAKAMIDQVDHFVEFYDELDNMGIKDSVYQKWYKE